MQHILITTSRRPSMATEDLQCPSCKVIISRETEPSIIRPQRSSCPYCGAHFDHRSRRASMKIEDDPEVSRSRMRRSASASLPALNNQQQQRANEHAIGGFLITSLGRVTLGKMFCMSLPVPCP